jgi:hypothetical protein
LNELVREGFTQRAAVTFVVSFIAIRKLEPKATIEGIFDAALLSGLDTVLESMRAETQATQPSAPKPKRKTRPAARLVK